MMPAGVPIIVQKRLIIAAITNIPVKNCEKNRHQFRLTNIAEFYNIICGFACDQPIPAIRQEAVRR